MPRSLLLLLAIIAPPVSGFMLGDMSGLVGYTVLGVKTIEGWRDDEESDDSSFEGCEHGRLIIFTDGTYLTCAEYGYQYAYRPQAVIFGRSFTHEGQTLTNFKMLVDDRIYNMQ